MQAKQLSETYRFQQESPRLALELTHTRSPSVGSRAAASAPLASSKPTSPLGVASTHSSTLQGVEQAGGRLLSPAKSLGSTAAMLRPPSRGNSPQSKLQS